jgi:hypothetical protein
MHVDVLLLLLLLMGL